MGILEELLKREKRSLPPFPEIGIKLLQALLTKTSIELEETIEKTPEIMNYLIKMANHPRFKKGEGKVTDLRMANLILGESSVKLLLLGFISKQLIKSTFNEFNFHKFWARAISQSVAIFFLSDIIDQIPPHLVYSAFLLDYGVLLLYLINPEKYLLVLKLKREGKDLIEAEREVFGVSHPEVGAEYFENYFFPRRLILNLFYHHREKIEEIEVPQEIKRDLYFLKMIDEGVGSFFSRQRERRFKQFRELASPYLTQREIETFGEVFPSIANTYLELLDLIDFRLVSYSEWLKEKEIKFRELEIKKTETKEDLRLTLEEYKNRLLELHLEKKELELKIESLINLLKESTIYDEITGVFRKEYFLRRLKEELLRARRYGRTFSFLAIEIEKLEEIGRNYGLGEQEKFLKELANELKRTLRRVDIIGCLEDWNKFWVILPETPSQGAMVVARKLLRKIETLFYKFYQLKFSSYIVVLTYNPKSIDPKREPSEVSLVKLLERGIEVIKTKTQNRILLLKIEQEIE